MPPQILTERHAKMIPVTLETICRTSANLDLRREEKESFHKSGSHNMTGEKIAVHFPSGSLHIEREDNATCQLAKKKKKQEKNKGKCIQTHG